MSDQALAQKFLTQLNEWKKRDKRARENETTMNRNIQQLKNECEQLKNANEQLRRKLAESKEVN